MERGRREGHVRRIEAREFNIRHMATCRTYVTDGLAAETRGVLRLRKGRRFATPR
jgi:hypothetical protein